MQPQNIIDHCQHFPGSWLIFMPEAYKPRHGSDAKMRGPIVPIPEIPMAGIEIWHK